LRKVRGMIFILAGRDFGNWVRGGEGKKEKTTSFKTSRKRDHREEEKRRGKVRVISHRDGREGETRLDSLKRGGSGEQSECGKTFGKGKKGVRFLQKEKKKKSGTGVPVPRKKGEGRGE